LLRDVAREVNDLGAVLTLVEGSPVAAAFAEYVNARIASIGSMCSARTQARRVRLDHRIDPGE